MNGWTLIANLMQISQAAVQAVTVIILYYLVKKFIPVLVRNWFGMLVIIFIGIYFGLFAYRYLFRFMIYITSTY